MFDAIRERNLTALKKALKRKEVNVNAAYFDHPDDPLSTLHAAVKYGVRSVDHEGVGAKMIQVLINAKANTELRAFPHQFSYSQFVLTRVGTCAPRSSLMSSVVSAAP